MKSKLIPSPALYNTLLRIARRIISRINNGSFSGKENSSHTPDGSFIAVGNHTSRYDYMYMAEALFPRRINFVVSAFYTQNILLGKMLQQIGVIPRIQFQADAASIKAMKNVISEGGVLGLYPHGQITNDGASPQLASGSGKLLKLLKAPVVVIKMNGGFLAGPKWCREARRGKVEVTARILFTKEDVESLPAELLEAGLDEALSFNDYEWNRSQQNSYRSKANAKGLDNLLYRCPVCETEFSLKVKGDEICCLVCASVGKIRSTGLIESKTFPFDSPPAWNSWQAEREMADMKVRGAKISAHVSIKEQDKFHRGFFNHKTGTAILTREGVVFEPDDASENRIFAASQLAFTACTPGEEFELGEKGVITYFYPDDGRIVNKWVLAAKAVSEDSQAAALHN